MPLCAHCGQQWGYKETFTAIWRMKLKCSYCNQTNYHSAKARKKSMFFSVTFSPIVILAGTWLTSLLWVIPIAIVMFIIICVVYPFTVDTSKEEEPLW